MSPQGREEGLQALRVFLGALALRRTKDMQVGCGDGDNLMAVMVLLIVLV